MRAVATKIKVGRQNQAGKPIFLLPTGVLECGKFRYEGRCKKQFRSLFSKIHSLAHTRPRDGILDVSTYRYWDAPRIYNEYVVPRWCRSVSATRLEKFACETQIIEMLRVIQAEFKRAVGLRWKKEFQKRGSDGANTLGRGWQIL